MKKLSEQQIKQALDSCRHNDTADCKLCPLKGERYCVETLAHNALELIKHKDTLIGGARSEYKVCHVAGDVLIYSKTLDDYYKFRDYIKCCAEEAMLNAIASLLGGDAT